LIKIKIKIFNKRATTRDCPYISQITVGAILYGCPYNSKL